MATIIELDKDDRHLKIDGKRVLVDDLDRRQAIQALKTLLPITRLTMEAPRELLDALESIFKTNGEVWIGELLKKHGWEGSWAKLNGIEEEA